MKELMNVILQVIQNNFLETEHLHLIGIFLSSKNKILKKSHFLDNSAWEPNQDNGGSCQISTYAFPDTTPRIFNCSTTDCTKSITNNQQYVNCNQINCHCTQWCNDIAKSAIDSISGSAEFVMQLEGQVTLTQSMGIFTMNCKAYSCQLPGLRNFFQKKSLFNLKN